MSAWATILAGGVGSRFWPLSTPSRPKQLLALVTDEPLLSDAVHRLHPLVPPERTLILTNATLASSVAELLPEIPRENVIAEPRPAGTAAALAWAAARIAERAGPDAMMISLHADWAIGDPSGYRATLDAACKLAEAERGLVTVGVVPSRPDPGFGYIQPGAPVGDGYRVERFVEKPDRMRAAEMVDQGYLWNSGIFVWRAGDYLDEVRDRSPEVGPALPSAVRGDIDAFFAEVTPISVDHGVLERSERVLVLAGDFGWDDVGTWAALHRVRRHDASGNAMSGEAWAEESSGNVVHADAGRVVLYGVSDLVVVTGANGLTLVTTKDRAADLKSLLERLPAELRELP